MLNQPTIDKRCAMRMRGMAEACNGRCRRRISINRASRSGSVC